MRRLAAGDFCELSVVRSAGQPNANALSLQWEIQEHHRLRHVSMMEPTIEKSRSQTKTLAASNSV